MAQQTDENGKPLTYWGGVDFTNKNANNIKSDSTQLSGTILASESLGVDNLVNKQQTAMQELWAWIDANIHEESFNLNDAREISIQREKEQTEAAYHDGVNAHRTDFCNRDEYFNKTFKQD